MKTRVDATRAAEINFKILNNHVIRVDATRADEISFKILNSHVFSPTADSQMNLKVVPDRDNAHPKEIFRFNFDQSDNKS